MGMVLDTAAATINVLGKNRRRTAGKRKRWSLGSNRNTADMKAEFLAVVGGRVIGIDSFRFRRDRSQSLSVWCRYALSGRTVLRRILSDLRRLICRPTCSPALASRMTRMIDTST